MQSIQGINWNAVAKWRDELRSGKYPQGKRCLRSSTGQYCCLGVFVEGVANQKPDRLSLSGDRHLYEGTNGATLTNAAIKILGLTKMNPAIFGVGAYILNDSPKYNLTFDEIADLLDLAILEREAGVPDSELIT